MIKNLQLYKKVDVKRTILLNFAYLGMPILTVLYLILCFDALNKISFQESILKVPFIILIAMSAIKLIGNYNPPITLIKKIRIPDIRGKEK